MEFLPNGDLIIVSLDDESKDYKIYLYPFINKPAANSAFWKYSQTYDIEIPESLRDEQVYCTIYQTKLFLVFGRRSIQWDLLTMTYDVQYFFNYHNYQPYTIVTNKNQTLLALVVENHIDLYSMETGMRILRYEG